MITTRKEGVMITGGTLFMLVLGPFVAFAVSAIAFLTARIFFQKGH